jgi:hypothetical protein
MVISCIREQDLESIAEVVLSVCRHGIHLYILFIKSLFRCGNST